MKTRHILWIFTFLLGNACMPEEALPLRNTGSVPEYFIECYCQPGENLVLTATHVIPLTDNVQYDFPQEMDVTHLYTGPDHFILSVRFGKYTRCAMQLPKYKPLRNQFRGHVAPKDQNPRQKMDYSQNHRAEPCLYRQLHGER